jgi:hypothetical protein
MLNLATVIVNKTRAEIMAQFPDLVVTDQGDFSRIQSPEPKAFTEVWYANLESPLPELAAEISKKLEAVTLAVINWDDDLLRIWAFSSGEFVTTYDSNPSYATCTITPPELEPDTGEKLAGLFHVPEQAKAVKQVLTRKKGFTFINETQRLEQLFALLKIPT